jgi:hypothetical protein
VVTPTTGLYTTEAGRTATFTVALAGLPTHNVTIPLTSSNTREGTVSPTTLTFTPAKAMTPQTVTVRGVDDPNVDGSRAYTVILWPAQSDDLLYAELDPADVAVINDDNERSGFCSLRPRIEVSSARTGPGQLSVTVRATSTQTHSDNRLTELRFRGPTGTPTAPLVDIAGAIGRSGTFTQPLADRPTSVTFVVRAPANGPFTLPFDVVDSCGPWPTFVGDGGR